ncbi:hypothetical protein BC739_002959 [Kutzneria viridogrisea]|uniref:S-adenosyl methyltransferase n=1 Tax=Kutzneria viridogrisea TaxID=47990 RepID=A0ABR6BFV1_9PSEU|nr:hypothetical protein [Kutzneria viridogrisea]
MNRPDWAPRDVDMDRASAARLYDFFLGGSFNFEVDRELGRRVATVAPAVFDFARLNRAFLRRAVRFLVSQGVTQFLDIGSGIPTAGNVHEVAQRVRPGCRVVYVDNDPVAVAHSEVLLAGNPHVVAVQADMRDPGALLNDPGTARLLDFSEPIGLLMVAVHHFLPPADEPERLMARYREVLPLGSYLALSHITSDAVAEQVSALVELYRESTHPVTVRSKAEVATLFEGFELVQPGLVFTPQWRPESPEDLDEHPEHAGVYAGVGRKSALG